MLYTSLSSVGDRLLRLLTRRHLYTLSHYFHSLTHTHAQGPSNEEERQTHALIYSHTHTLSVTGTIRA